MLTANYCGRRLTRFAIACCLSGCAGLASVRPLAAELPVAGAAAPESCRYELGELLRTFAALPGIEARFVEERHIALLERPLQTSGVIYYAAPQLFARYTEAPAPSVLIIEAEQIRLLRGDEVESIAIDVAPVVKPLVKGFLAVLQGDRAALDEAYALDLQPDASCVRWVLTLTPKAAPLRDFVSRIVIEGQGSEVTVSELSEPNGDRTRTTYTTIDGTRRFSAEEKAKVFRLSGTP